MIDFMFLLVTLMAFSAFVIFGVRKENDLAACCMLATVFVLVVAAFYYGMNDRVGFEQYSNCATGVTQ